MNAYYVTLHGRRPRLVSLLNTRGSEVDMGDFGDGSSFVRRMKAYYKIKNTYFDYESFLARLKAKYHKIYIQRQAMFELARFLSMRTGGSCSKEHHQCQSAGARAVSERDQSFTPRSQQRISPSH